MHPPRRHFCAAATIVAAAALGISACGGSAAEPAANPRAEIASAADASSAEKGYTMRMSIVENVPGSDSVTIDLDGAVSTPTTSGTLTMTLHAASGTEQIHEIVRGPVVYMQFPAPLQAKLGNGKPWVKLDARKVRDDPALASVAQLENNTSENDPTTSFNYLKSELKNLTVFGTATVAGVQTTHYGAIANLRKAGLNSGPRVHAAIQKVLRNLQGQIVNETAMPVEVWVDRSNLVRELKYDMELIPKGSTQVVDAQATLVMTHYGPEPTPTAPPADQTTNLLPLLRASGQG